MIDITGLECWQDATLDIEDPSLLIRHQGAHLPNTAIQEGESESMSFQLLLKLRRATAPHLATQLVVAGMGVHQSHAMQLE